MSYNTCQVLGCRYSDEHTTERHCCGICNLLGHGQMECSNKNLIKELEKYKDDFIFDWCEIEGCIDAQTHTTKGHSCLYCETRLDDLHLKYCPNNKNTTEGNTICDDLENISHALLEHIEDVKVKPNEYKISEGGMGSTWLIRNNNGKNEYLFIDIDNWGQYGKDTSHLPRYKAFTYGYTLVETELL
jgi:hypothetical protein